MMSVTLRDNSFPRFVSSALPWIFPDVWLLSNDGHHVAVNGAMVGGALPAMRKVLDSEQPYQVLSTELSTAELKQIVHFVFGGIVLIEQVSEEIIKMFRQFGVDMTELQMEKVPISDIPEVIFRSNSKLPFPVFDAVIKSEEEINQEIEISNGRRKSIVEEDNLDSDSSWIPEELKVKAELSTDEDKEPKVASDTKPKTPRRKRAAKPNNSSYFGSNKDAKTSNVDEIDQEERLKHEFVIDGERNHFKYQCSVCLFGTANAETFSQHELRHKHATAANGFFYFCPICEAGFGQQRENKVHMSEKHDGETFKCKVCDKVFPIGFYKRYLEHVSSHTAKPASDAFPMPCPNCGLKVKTRDILYTHNKRWGSLHGSECAWPGCVHKFETWQGHVEHVREKHEDVWKYVCGKCPEVFDSKEDRYIHRKRNHESIWLKSKFCEKCGKSFKFLQLHMQEKHGEEHLPCATCGKVFSHPKALARHINRHRKQFSCELCGKQCTSRNILKNHVINIHTPDEEKPFRCEFCKKGFAVERHLREHVNIHTNTKPHKCQFCGAGFNSLANKNAHQKTVHMGVKREKGAKPSQEQPVASQPIPVLPAEMPPQQQHLMQQQPVHGQQHVYMIQ